MISHDDTTQVRRRKGVRGGFIHVPWSEEQAARHPGEPGMPVATMAEGVRIALEAALAHPVDLPVPGGAEH